MNETLLEVKNLSQHYRLKGRKIDGRPPTVRAIDDISFDIFRGETLALVGESGSGKTTTGLAVLNLLEETKGQVLYAGENLLEKRGRAMRRLRPKMQMVFQDPYGCLDPRRTVFEQIARPLVIHGRGGRAEVRSRVLELIDVVGLRPEYLDRYPHEFSGGQRQRIGIARALALTPEFVVCDEPVSALDVSIQAQVINLLQHLQEQFQLTYLFISHDLRVVHHISDRVAVMYLGRIVEIADKDTLYDRHAHPYTEALLSAIPEAAAEVGLKERIKLEGDVPSPLRLPSGCRFHPRCPKAIGRCREEAPPLYDLGSGHRCACHLVDQAARHGAPAPDSSGKTDDCTSRPEAAANA